MKLVLLLILAVSSKAASIGEEDSQAVSGAEASASAETSLGLNDTISAGELDDFTSTNQTTSADAPITAQETKPSGLDVLPFPLSVFIRIFSKQALTSFDPDSICDTVQLIDWNIYRDMLLKEDYEGFRQKAAKDEILSSLGETLQEYLIKYSKIISEGSTSAIEKDFKRILNVFSLNETPQKPVTVEKTIKDWMNLLVSERSVARNNIFTMQKYIKLMQDTLQERNLLDSLDLSQKDNIEKAQNGTGV